MLPRDTWRWLIFLCSFAYLWLFPYTEQINNPNEMVRVYAVRALVEQGTYVIGTRGPDGDRGPIYDQWGYVNDKALVCTDGRKPPDCFGKLYPAKAPGLTYLGVLPYAALWQFHHTLHHRQPTRPETVWWLRFCVVILPTLLMLAWLARWLPTRLNQPGLGLASVLAAALGSLSLTYAQMFAGHQVGSVALLLLFAVIVRAGAIGNAGAVVLAGLLGASAVVIEFTLAPAVLLLGLWLLLRRRDPMDVLRLLIGGALPILLLLHNNWRSFGSPLQLSYNHLENPGFIRDMAPGFMGIHLPTLEKVRGSLISPFTGLYFFAPWTLLAWLGLLGALPFRREDARRWLLDRRGEAFVAFLVCLYFLFFQCTHSLWRGGWVVGPRYITACVPFAAIATAHGLDALPRFRLPLAGILLGGAGIAAIVITGTATAVSQGFPFEVYNPLREVVAPLLTHGWTFTNPLMRLGIPAPWNALPYFLALIVGALWLAWLAVRTPRLRARAIGFVLALVLAGALVRLAWMQAGTRTPEDQMITLRFLMDTWTPPHPPGSRTIDLTRSRPQR